ncbi:MAG: DNA translocase FtsK 4TM domain-containing protein [Fibromonadaceae bacterium]|jgi:DNA segregation ATPase FtsK/SpoIIIE-like protein|nr:DNA translocase FtsK 4TM domain-containing protein [Fibromonadaceae bacterium]
MQRTVVKRKKSKAKARTVATPVEPQIQGSGRGKIMALFVFLLTFIGISVLFLIGDLFAEPGTNRNLFGPYAAKFADTQLCLFGPLPLTFLLLSCCSLTIWFYLKKVSVPPKKSIISYGHYAFGFVLLYVFFSVILSIIMPDIFKNVPLSIKTVSREYAGLIGLFLAKRAFPPIFGQDTGGLLFCSYLGVIMTSFCFGLKPRHLIELARKIKFGVQTILYNFDFAREKPKVTIYMRQPDTGDFVAVRLGEVRPAKGSPFGKQEKENSAINKDPFIPDAETQIISAEESPTDVIEKIERELKRATDPREVRRLRDELAEYRRIEEMNKWEDVKGGELKIEGLLGKRETIGNEPLIVLDEKAPTEIPIERHTQLSDINAQLTTSISALALTQYDEYRIPLIHEILGPVPDQTIDYTEEELQKIGKDIESQLDNFKVKGKVTGIMTGPVITRFEIEPGPGVKVSRFENLADDLALTLRTASVRVIASIPGKSAVGIEIPNRKPQIVFGREIFESPKFTKDPKKIQVVLGKDIMGDSYVTDLTRTPHLLIAGQTGAGKSVCINVLLASILFSKTPDEVRLILVDPKVVELAMYKDIPHLLHPVITSPEVAVQALKWLCMEMDRRYEVLATARVRNIEGFNDKFKASELGEEVPEEERKLMPFIVVIIDELADLMMTAGKEIETSIARIAQKARAVGIHLVLATQRPSVNVITGVIKANLPSRISFKVASYIDSKTILDGVGAEKLLGKGDMLFRSNDNPEPVRIHGAFLKDSEVETLANACSSQNVNFERVESFDLGEAEGEDGSQITPVKSKDPLFWEAARIGLEAGELSISTLQRRLSIGFSRAGKIMDQLTAEGICGKPNGSKPRKMLMNEEMLGNLEKR